LSCESGDGNKADDGTGETDGGHENKAIALIIVSLPGLVLFWDIIVLIIDKEARNTTSSRT
jgi:hypothetical protein